MSKRIHFTLSDEALAVIERRAPRNLDQWLSNAIVEYALQDNDEFEETEKCQSQARMAQIEQMLKSSF